MVVLFLVGVLGELGMYTVPGLWRFRKIVSVCSAILTAAALGLFLSNVIIAGGLRVLWVCLGLITIYRIFNLFRVFKGRMHEQYLRRATRRTGLVLLLLQVIGGAYWVYERTHPLRVAQQQFWIGLAASQLVVACIIFLTTLRTSIKMKHRPNLQHFSDRELPSVSVAIPARNETDDLTTCLASIIASDYPKLEVLVLDDCSQDKTPELIRSFAHDGVRFVQGEEPAERWLAKNQAYNKLAQEASGELILFCGVDVRFGPQTVRALVTDLLVRNKEMVGVLPAGLGASAATSFIQTMRYWWEIALPRRWFNRPAVLSTCWLIQKQALKKAGGFAAVQHAILPEAYFARAVTKHDGYSFVRSDDVIEVKTTKTLFEQFHTALRTRYPQLRRRPEWVLLLSLAEAGFLLMPFIVVILGFWTHFGIALLLALVACLLLIASNCLIIALAAPTQWWIGLLNFPLVAGSDLLLLYLSMWKYEFSEVDWKGRNVCIPVMHVIPRLPRA